MSTIEYWKNLGSIMDKAKEKIHKQFLIGDTCFMSSATIGGNLYTIHQKNLDYVQKYSNDLISVIIILGTYVNCGENKFHDGNNINDIVKRVHVLKHSHGRCVIGDFDKKYMKSLFGMFIYLLYLSSSTNQYFLTL